VKVQDDDDDDDDKGKVKGKVKLYLCFFSTEHQAMKAYLGSEVIAPHFLHLGTI
jgi:hypothetical protein